MVTSRERRIAHELKDLERDRDTSGVYAYMTDGVHTNHLTGQFLGPPDTPYAGGTFVIDIQIPFEYPFKPPIMNFTTKIYHPNVSSQTGAICLDTIGKSWSPVNTIKTVLLSLRLLLQVPNPNDPQDAQVARMLISNPQLFEQEAHDWAVRYAGAPRRMPPPDFDAAVAAVTRAQEERQNAQQSIRPEQYKGYNSNLVQRFMDMGFGVDTVVRALEQAGVDRRGGTDYELHLSVIGDVTAHLFGEQ